MGGLVMAKWITPPLIIALGLGALGMGAFYGVITVGVPTPHASPAVAAQEARDSNLSGIIALCGILLAGLGTIGLVVVAIYSLAQRGSSES
jgi:hypothetical protein